MGGSWQKEPAKGAVGRSQRRGEMRAGPFPLQGYLLLSWAAGRAAHLDHRSMGEAWRFFRACKAGEGLGQMALDAGRALSSQTDRSSPWVGV